MSKREIKKGKGEEEEEKKKGKRIRNKNQRCVTYVLLLGGTGTAV
jgi:hypothetical protein